MIITTESSSSSFPSLVLIHIANYIPLSRLVQFQLVCSEWYHVIEELESGEFWNIKFCSYYSEKRKFYESLLLDLYWNDKTLSKRLKFIEKNQQLMLKKLKHKKNFSRQQLKQAIILEWYQYYNTFFKYEGHHVGQTNFYNYICNLPEKSIVQQERCNLRAKQFLHHMQHFPQAIEKFMFKKSYRFLLPLLRSDTCTNDHLSVICEKLKPRFDFFTASLYFDYISLKRSNPLSTDFMKYILESYQTFLRNGMKELFVKNCLKLIPMSQRNAELDLFIEHVTLHNNGDSIQSIITETSFAKIIIGALKDNASLHDIRMLSEKLGRQVPASILIESPPSEDFFSCYYDLDLRQDVEQFSKKLHETFKNDHDTLLLESIVLELDINLFKSYNDHNIMATILSFNKKQPTEKLITMLKKQAEKNNNKYGYFDGDLMNWRKFDPCGVWMHKVRYRYGLSFNPRYSIGTFTWPFIQQSNAIFHHSTLIVVGNGVVLPEICEGLKQRTRVFLDMNNDTEGIPLTQFMLEL
ncbi:hypothetical protein C9374_010576 [Naegleria lovaniensis]|uniref:F-box domain-containing protein n=1 Tax=Naegleria lovaniensis TaxID=51637 RepID=A0AA88KJ57_NAELO|nr:uncharacterized protein C9374_010576 [Naegleria lovaniensis]KAG2374557.1 hypothetical protein C9374_010576 [Naegleria lovaniensis]